MSRGKEINTNLCIFHCVIRRRLLPKGFHGVFMNFLGRHSFLTEVLQGSYRMGKQNSRTIPGLFFNFSSTQFLPNLHKQLRTKFRPTLLDMSARAIKGAFYTYAISCSNIISEISLFADEYGLSTSNHIDGALVPTKSLWSPKTDLAELFSKLGLGKYTDLFQQQEVRHWN